MMYEPACLVFYSTLFAYTLYTPTSPSLHVVKQWINGALSRPVTHYKYKVAVWASKHIREGNLVERPGTVL